MHKTKSDRQQEAIERNIARDNRTDTEQIAMLRRRPGRSLKEMNRLLLGIGWLDDIIKGA